MTHPAAARIPGLYEDQAQVWIDHRQTLGADNEPGPDRPLSETDWLERFMAALPPGGTVLDVGCGSGQPVARTLMARGFRVTGIDTSPRLIAHARSTLAAGQWQVADMRQLDLVDRFDGVLAWNSLFHLTAEDQAVALPRILAQGAARAVVMFTSGPEAGEAIGQWQGEPLYHASLSPGAYGQILGAAGFVPAPHLASENAGLNRLVWLARRGMTAR